MRIINTSKQILIFEVDNTTWSILSGIETLFNEGHVVIGFIVLFFSVAMPALKMGCICSGRKCFLTTKPKSFSLCRLSFPSGRCWMCLSWR
ncbi:MAG: paraquat-inducible protein A [Pirellulales bacterium]|nr:paraquat-inducible protein A [Pirellulales bacterium]